MSHLSIDFSKFSASKEEALRDMVCQRNFLCAQRRIFQRSTRLPVGHVGKGHYYVLFTARQHETIKEVCLDNVHTRHGGYVKQVRTYAKGSQCNLESLRGYPGAQQPVRERGRQRGPGGLGWRGDSDGRVAGKRGAERGRGDQLRHCDRWGAPGMAGAAPGGPPRCAGS